MVLCGEKFFGAFALYILIQAVLRPGLADPTFPICPGICIDRETPCNNAIDPTHCGSMSICCLDNFELTTEQGFDFSTLQPASDDQWISETDSNNFQVNPAAEIFETNAFESDNSETFTTTPPNEDVFFTTQGQNFEEIFTTATPRDETFFKLESSESDDSNLFTVMPQEAFSTIAPQSFYTEIQPVEQDETNEVIELDHCPGACIPTQHSSLCQYAMQSDLCPPGKTCCATRAAAQALNLQKSSESHVEQSYQTNECPGKCVHQSLSMHCDNVLQGYSCPMGSTCCDSEVVQYSPIVGCSGECLPPQSTYLCLSPYELVPGTNCESSTVCCMRTDAKVEEHEMDKETMFSTYDVENSQNEPTGFASDEYGQLYYVYQNGQFQPLPTISLDDTRNPALAHIGDVEVSTGKASLFKDRTGSIYQLSVIQPPQNFHQPQMGFVDQNTHSDQDYNPHIGHDFEHSIHGNSYRNMGHSRHSNMQNVNHPPRHEEPKTIFSAPDDVDDIEENLKDVILPDENENILVDGKSDVPPGERTLVKPKCPGSCLTSFLRFTCIGNHKMYDGFTCTSDTTCCASITDIEEHEQYLNTLSPLFDAPVENEENVKSCFNNWPRDFHMKEEKEVSNYCWQVAIINPLNQYICGGALIHDSWVLTAAHCVTGALKENKPLYVRAGVTDLTSAADNAAAQTRRALSIFVHHKHNSMSLDNDIAILRLQTPLQMNFNVCIACLPTTSSMPHNDSVCRVSGYGFLSKAGTMSLKLDDARIPLIEDMDCIANVTDALSTVFILPASSFCAGGMGNEACQGDAGAPLMCENNGRQELTGLVSWSLGCGKDEVPSIYVKIPMFMSWINQIMSASTFLKALH